MAFPTLSSHISTREGLEAFILSVHESKDLTDEKIYQFTVLMEETIHNFIREAMIANDGCASPKASEEEIESCMSEVWHKEDTVFLEDRECPVCSESGSLINDLRYSNHLTPELIEKHADIRTIQKALMQAKLKELPQK